MGFFMKRPRKLLGILSVIAYAFVVPGTANAQWVQTSGPGGNVLSLTANGGNLFAGTGGGGVFLTTNNGTNWTPVNNGLTNPVVFSLAASGGYIFAGTQGGGVFLTTNNGTNWTPVNTGLTNLNVYALAANGGNVFTGTNGGGVFLTTNNGTNWTPVNTGLTNLTVSALAASGGYVFAGTQGGGVFLTTNNGTNWVDFNAGLTSLNVLALAASGSNLFAGVTAAPGVRRRPLSDVGNLPAAPTLSSPANGATNVALSPTMTWNTVTGATTYFLQVSTVGTFTSTVFNDSTLTGTSRAIGPLAGLTVYYWRVRAKNAFGSSNWSSVWSFTTFGIPPVAPVLSSPADSATIFVPCPTLTWNASSGAASYTLNVSTASNFSTLTVNQPNIVSTSQVVSGLSNNTTYYWRVNAINPAGPSPWSDTWSFTMDWDTTWGCISHWSFDSSSGNTYYDVTGHGYDATATGSGVGLTLGVVGVALFCPGGGYEIAVANSSNNFYLSKFSIECWFYSTIAPSSIITAAKIVDYQYVQSGVRNGYSFHIIPSGNVLLSMSSGSGSAWETVTSSAVISATTWYHLACTYDSSYLRVYINGVLSGSLAYQGTYVKPPNDARIGCARRADSSNAVQFVSGAIDELKLYNYALPADSIATHYLATAIKSTQKIPLLASSLKVQSRNSLLTISLPSSMLGKAVDLAVYSASGRVLVKKTVRSAAARFTLPVPNLAFGAYVLSVNDGNRKVTMKFVVVR